MAVDQCPARPRALIWRSSNRLCSVRAAPRRDLLVRTEPWSSARGAGGRRQSQWTIDCCITNIVITKDLYNFAKHEQTLFVIAMGEKRPARWQRVFGHLPGLPSQSSLEAEQALPLPFAWQPDSAQLQSSDRSTASKHVKTP